MQPLEPLSLPLRGRILLEASAGTGKTYTIALLFLRLLLERELSVDEILVVTFTRAATEELRGRVRQRIREALDTLQGNGPDDLILQKLMARTQAANPGRAAILLADALTRMDEAAIYTIHGFCRRMLQEHAFESGAPFGLEFLENEMLLRTRIMEDFWRSRFYAAPPEEALWATSLWATPQDLYNNLGGHLSRPDILCVPVIHDDELAEMGRLLLPLFNEIQAVWREQRSTIISLLRGNKRLSRNNTSGYGDKRLDPAIATMDEFTAAKTMPWLLPALLDLFALKHINSSLLKNKHDPPEHRFFHLMDDFRSKHRQMTRGRKIALLLAAREYLRTELKRRKQEQAKLYFDDLLLAMAAALKGRRFKKLAQGINTRFPAILIDEFQDTDPLQYRIFSRIHKADPAAGLFLIGDPKQAIYGFRGADIFTYLMAGRETPPDNRFTMTTNYRSTAPMVAAVNRLFDIDNPFLLARDAIPFTPVRAARSTDQGLLTRKVEIIPPLTCLLLPEQKTGKPLAKDKAAKQAARFCALEIKALLSGGKEGTTDIHGKAPAGGDIGILVRTHREAETIRAALGRIGLASVYQSESTIFASPEAGQMQTLLSALLNPTEPGLARTLLATDLFGYTGEQLEQLRHDELRWEEILTTLSHYQQMGQQKGILPMFQTLLTEQQVVRRLLANPGGERTLTNFLHLAELLQEASHRLSGIEELLRRLTDLMQRPEEQGDSSQLRLESDENLIKIVTIHKAKGLEYPLVFLPFLWSARPCNPKEPFSFHHPDQPELLCIDLGSGSDENFFLAEQERLAADLRLLYVALTRARSSCFFCWGRISKMNESALCFLLHRETVPDRKTLLTDLAELHSAQAPVAIKTWPDESSPPPLPPEPDTTRLAAVRFTGTIDTGWQIFSYSRLTADNDPQPERPDYDRSPGAVAQRPGLDVFAFPKGAAAGTCLHAVLENISFTDSAGHGTIVADQLARAGFEERWQDVVTAWMSAVLATELEPGFSLARLNKRNRINEMAFTFPLSKMRISRFNRALGDHGIAPLPRRQDSLRGLMVGFIDLVFRWKDRYYIADYKSNFLGDTVADYTPPGLKRAMFDHRYDLQYLIYTLALHRFLRSRIRDYDYERYFGGIYYLFLRGMDPNHPPKTGVFAARPPLDLINRLDRCCREAENADE